MIPPPRMSVRWACTASLDCTGTEWNPNHPARRNRKQTQRPGGLRPTQFPRFLRGQFYGPRQLCRRHRASTIGGLDRVRPCVGRELEDSAFLAFPWIEATYHQFPAEGGRLVGFLLAPYDEKSKAKGRAQTQAHPHTLSSAGIVLTSGSGLVGHTQ